MSDQTDRDRFWEESALKSRFLRFWPSPTLLVESRMLELVDQAGPGDLILNIGSGRLDRLPGAGERSVVNLDRQSFANVELVGDAHKLPVADGSIGAVICAAVLEQTRRPWIIAEEVHRVLRPDGSAYVGVPFLQPFHASPSDYYRFTQMGLREIMRDFEEIESGVSAGPASAVVFVLMYFAGTWVSNYYVSNALRFAAGWVLSPLKYLDRLLARKK